MFRIRPAGPWVALALPALVAIGPAIVSVQRVSLAPAEVPSGATSTGTVTLNAAPIVQARVALSSSHPGMAAVPASILVGVLSRGTFAITTTSGQAGCATITAREGTTPAKSALLFVHPRNLSSSPVRLTLSPTSVGGGLTSTGTVLVTPSSAAGQVVNLTSSNPSVTVPASVTLAASEIGAGIATFSIGTSAVTGLGTCSIITATFGNSRSRALLKVIPFVQG